jgi:hypothetical protein
MNTRVLQLASLVGALVLTSSGFAVTLATGSAGAKQAAKTGLTRAPTQVTAALPGTITGVDAKKGEISIDSQRFLIRTGLVALLDKRRETDGLLSLATLVPGMQVQYRTEGNKDGTRVVELVVLRGPQRRAVDGGKSK